MIHRKHWKLILILFLTIVVVQSCEKDELSNPQEQLAADKDGKDTENTPTSDTSNETGSNGSEEVFGSITLYTVDGDNLIKKKDFKVTGKELELQQDTQKHQKIWDLVKKIVPLNHRARMNEFMVYSGKKDKSSGYVFPTSYDLSTWQMAIAIDFAFENDFNSNGQLAYTIIHEFGHILTLDKTQVDSKVAQNNCNNYFTGEGCAKDNAYINKTFKLGWADIWSEFQNLESEQASESFYKKYKERFVTRYASVSPGEDIAEVFATFVTRNGGVDGSSIAEQKIQIMYDHTELIGLRNYVRGHDVSAKRRSFLPVAGSWKKANTFGSAKKTQCVRGIK